MTDHLQAAKDLMGLVDELTGGPVDPEKGRQGSEVLQGRSPRAL